MGSSISLCNVVTVTSSSLKLFEMECNQYKSVVLFVDSLVRSTHARRLEPDSSKSLTDFSICSILGLENDITQTSTSSGKLNFFNSSKLGYIHGTLKITYKYDSNRPSLPKLYLISTLLVDEILKLRVRNLKQLLPSLFNSGPLCSP